VNYCLLEEIGDEFLIKTAQLEMMDDILKIGDRTAIEWTKELAREEGILAGGSSGANVWGALQVAKKIDREANIVTLICDSGYKYFSSIYNDEWLIKNDLV
jgi:cysteine synthase